MQNNMLYTTCVLICVVFFNVSLICFECVLDVLSKQETSQPVKMLGEQKILNTPLRYRR